jgi:hypothetical protein
MGINLVIAVIDGDWFDIRPYCDGGEHEARNGLLLIQKDGSMLEALKRLNGGTIHLPNREKDWPDRDRLALRFERIKAAA